MSKAVLTLIFFFTYLSASNLLLDRFFNDRQCDQILRNDGYFKTCYDYNAKGAKYVAYTLFGDKVNAVNINEGSYLNYELRQHITTRQYLCDTLVQTAQTRI